MSNTVLLEWSDALCVGIPEIDEQHQELVNLLNRLFLSVVQRDRDRVAIEILDALIDYTKTHFTLEEQLMRDAHYNPADYAEHQRTHRDFIDKVDLAAHKCLVEGKSVSFEMIHFLKHWLRDHILIADRQFAETALKAGYVPVPRAPVPSAVLRQEQVAKPWWKVW